MRGGVRLTVWLAAVSLGSQVWGCGRPFLARDGTLVLQQPGAHGASVITANGVEFHDRDDIPTRVVARSPYEPWRAPVGFILPANGRFTETSRPTVMATTGLAVVLRPSDTRVPSWGGEVLVRIDVLAPAAPGTARWGENVALVLDGVGADTTALVATALEQLGARDRVTVIDSRGPRVVVPTMPASHRSMALAAVQTHAGRVVQAGRDLAGALAAAREATKGTGARRVVLLGDGEGEILTTAITRSLEQLAEEHVAFAAIGDDTPVNAGMLRAMASVAKGIAHAERSVHERQTGLRLVVPSAGTLAFQDVVLSFDGAPAPSHVLEASGGDVRWRLESGELSLGDVRAGDARTEVVRVTVPPWQPGDAFTFSVRARYEEAATGEARELSAQIPCVYDDDIERIARTRHGDVIAYASALATLRRLDSAFAGPGIRRAGGLYALAQMHAQSMALLARDTHDAAIVEQAELLRALLSATHD